MDRITVTGLRVQAHHGVFDFERNLGQNFVVDVIVWADLAVAADGDDLSKTVHYGELSVAIHDSVRRDPVDLLETLAERVAVTALGFAAARAVRVVVHKPHAPIPVSFDDVTVTITRIRDV